MIPAFALAALLAAAPELPPELAPDPFTASVAVGGGWDSNVTRQAGAGRAMPDGSAAWRAGAGWIFSPGELDSLLLEATYEGAAYADEMAPWVHRPGAALAWLHPLGERLRLRAGLFGSWIGSEDADRRGVEGGLSASLGLELTRWLSVRGGVTGLRTEAADAAWSGHLTKLRGAVVVAPWRGATLSAGYGWQVGLDTALLPDPAAATVASGSSRFGVGSGAGTGAGSTSWQTAALLPVSSPASAHVLSIDLEQALGDRLFLAAGWSYTSGTSTAAGPWTGQSVLVEVGWRR